MRNILTAAGQASATKEAWKIQRNYADIATATMLHNQNTLATPSPSPSERGLKQQIKQSKTIRRTTHVRFPQRKPFSISITSEGPGKNNKLRDIYKRQNRQKSRSLTIFYGHKKIKKEHFFPPPQSWARAPWPGPGTLLGTGHLSKACE